MLRSFASPLALLAVLAACSSDQPSGVPGDTGDTTPFAGIAAGETIHFTGTEPFWSAEASGGTLIYRTPENLDGIPIAVQRFAGRGGLSFSGFANGASLDITVTPGECSDGMSDSTYPYTATLVLRQDTRFGCAWTDADPGTRPDRS